ncbi:hypothetical protein FBU30_010827 [Linnemannia zychae]|nr:hypothetical protein FBU30_010827 [Linnemannia zychae]
MELMYVHRQPSRLYIFIINFVTLLAGLILFAVGIRELADGYIRIVLYSKTLSWSLIVMSVIDFLVSLIGSICALSRSKRISIAYGTLLTILVVLQLVFLAYIMIRHDHMDILLDKAWQNLYDTNERALQDLETRLHCCGYQSVVDRAVPMDSRDACIKSPAFGYNTPCKKQLQQTYGTYELLTIVSITSIECLQLLALLATIALWRRLPSDDSIDGYLSAESSQRLLDGLRREDEVRAQSADVRDGYGSTIQ